MALILNNERGTYPPPSLWTRVPNGPVVFSWVDTVTVPVKMAVNWGGGREFCADTVAAVAIVARTAALLARCEKDEEKRILVLCLEGWRLNLLMFITVRAGT